MMVSKDVVTLAQGHINDTFIAFKNSRDYNNRLRKHFNDNKHFQIKENGKNELYIFVLNILIRI
jgi:hypothetical protein